MSHHQETQQERDERVLGVIAEAVCDHAMHAVAYQIGERLKPMVDAMYRRLDQLSRADLKLAVVLLIEQSGEAEKLAQQILTGLRLTGEDTWQQPSPSL